MEREEELRIAKKAAAEARALKADHSTAVAQLKEAHRNEMYLLQVKKNNSSTVHAQKQHRFLHVRCSPTRKKLTTNSYSI